MRSHPEGHPGHSAGRTLRSLAYQALLLGAACQPVNAATYYRVTDLGTLGGPYSHAWAINDNGQIVGESMTAENSLHAFLYSDGTMVDLGALPGGGDVRMLSARAINASGQVLGFGYKGEALAAVLYSGGAITVLGSFDPSGINDAGQVAGTALFAGHNVSHASLYDLLGGTLTDLGTLAGNRGDRFSAARGINARGEVVGVSEIVGSDFAERDIHAFLYTGGVMQDLGTLGGPDSWALAINDAGQVVGWSETATGVEHAFLYSGGTMLDLGTNLGDSSRAVAINEAGQVIGTFSETIGPTTSGDAFLYDDGQAQRLRTLIHPDYADFLVGVDGINNLGQMVGAGGRRSEPYGSSHAVLLTVTDDPLPRCHLVPVDATFLSIECRLDTLRARVEAEPFVLGPFQAKLMPFLDKAIARHGEAADFCATGDLKHSRKRLKKVVRAMKQFTDLLSSRPARNSIHPTLRDGLLTDGHLLADHATTLRASAVCPDSAPPE